jgi:hypothetical protein
VSENPATTWQLVKTIADVPEAALVASIIGVALPGMQR